LFCCLFYVIPKLPALCFPDSSGEIIAGNIVLFEAELLAQAFPSGYLFRNAN
jgi:hypothetical protein